jgi:hypothetical protein
VLFWQNPVLTGIESAKKHLVQENCHGSVRATIARFYVAIYFDMSLLLREI